MTKEVFVYVNGRYPIIGCDQKHNPKGGLMEGYRLTKERFEEICRGEGMREEAIQMLWPPPAFVPQEHLTDQRYETSIRLAAHMAVTECPEVFACRKSS